MNRIVFICLLGLGLLGCNGQKPAQPAPVNEMPEPAAAAEAAVPQKLTEAEIAKRQEIIEKMRKEGRIVQPLINIQLQVLDNHQISNEDVERSFLFRKAAITRCYSIELAMSGVFAGKASFRLKHVEDSGKPEVSEFSTDLPNEMASCVMAATERWPVPNGADFKVALEFSAIERTVEDIQKLVPADEHEHHHHLPADLDDMQEEAPMPVVVDE